jgi:diguanylate cyclase (GGDEF)-like protein
MSLRIKIGLFIAFLFITAIGNALLTFQLEDYADEKVRWINHTHDVIIETEQLLSSMQGTETGQRGFLLTHNPSYLEPYHRGQAQVKKSCDRLKYLTRDNAAQQKRLESIKTSIKLKFDELAETIRYAQANEYDKALAVVKEDRGKKHMDDIRAHLNEFIGTEKILLEKRKGDFREHRAKITTLIAVEVLFFIFLAIMTITFLNKNLFDPLRLLLSSTHKMEKGEKVSIADITSKDEMGFLISSFYKMNSIVHERTQNLQYKAHHDELTGLKNRTMLYEVIDNTILDSKQSNKKMALVFIDLNKFKPLNDTMGHDAGDAMLVETAKRLKKSTRSDDELFRVGGDEFVAIIKGTESISSIEHVINNLMDVFKEPMRIQGTMVQISISVGVAISPDNSEISEELMKMADIAMYEAKHDETTHLRFFESSMLKRSSD